MPGCSSGVGFNYLTFSSAGSQVPCRWQVLINVTLGSVIISSHDTPESPLPTHHISSTSSPLTSLSHSVLAALCPNTSLCLPWVSLSPLILSSLHWFIQPFILLVSAVCLRLKVLCKRTLPLSWMYLYSWAYSAEAAMVLFSSRGEVLSSPHHLPTLAVSYTWLQGAVVYLYFVPLDLWVWMCTCVGKKLCRISDYLSLIDPSPTHCVTEGPKSLSGAFLTFRETHLCRGCAVLVQFQSV